MEIVKAFFQGLWTMLSQIRIPIIDFSCVGFIVGIFITILLIECINKILGKDSKSDKS